jgi:hypothetical protein|tara:strand:- start:1088 stop:2041 length:954 start_codon:yes stop_codon:yes gene_type:complete
MIRRKILITGGCSFSDSWNLPESKYLYRRTWVNYIKEKYNFKKYVHMGNPASGNELIAERIVYALQTLLDKGYLSDDLYVGVMWSGIERKELFVSTQETDKYSELDDSVRREGENTLMMSHYSNVFSNTKGMRPGIVNVPNGYLKSGGLPYKDDWWKTKAQRDYFNLWYDNFYSVEKQFIDTLKSILLVQTFCERHNIKYFMSVWQNIFNARNPLDKHNMFYGDLPPKSYGDECVESRLQPKFVDIFNKSSRFLWSAIDFNKFIFYENDKVIYGGLTEYANVNKLEFWEDNAHVCYSGHKKFIDEYSKQIEEQWKIK